MLDLMRSNFQKIYRQIEMENITLAVKASWRLFPDRFEWLVSKGFPAEYTPDPENLSLISDHTRIFIKNGLPVRHHGFFPGFEFGSENEKAAEEAMMVHFRMLDSIKGIGEPFVTFHIGLDEQVEINPNRAKKNLKRLVQYAGRRGVTVCLENLKDGPTSDSNTLKEWVEYADAMIPLMLGMRSAAGLFPKRISRLPRSSNCLKTDSKKFIFMRKKPTATMHRKIWRSLVR